MPHSLSKHSRYLLVILAAVALIIIGIGVGWRSDSPPAPDDQTVTVADNDTDSSVQIWAAEQVTDQLPQFSLPDLSGQERHIADWAGDVLVINVWATWCAPCREEVPMLIEAQEQYREQGMTVIGLTLDQPTPTREFADTFGINYPLLIDDTSERAVMEKFGSDALGLPHTFIIDRDGRVAAFHLGLMTGDELAHLLAPLLEDS